MDEFEDTAETKDRLARIALWADLDDAEFDAFTNAVRQLRETDKLRSSGE